MLAQRESPTIPMRIGNVAMVQPTENQTRMRENVSIERIYYI